MIDQITQRIYNKSDADLRKKLENSIKWVWDESGHSCERPGISDLELLNKIMRGNGQPAREEMPWIGLVQKEFVEIAFLYLRDKYRSRAIYEFMSKVEAVGEIISQQESTNL